MIYLKSNSFRDILNEEYKNVSDTQHALIRNLFWQMSKKKFHQVGCLSLEKINDVIN